MIDVIRNEFDIQGRVSVSTELRRITGKETADSTIKGRDSPNGVPC